MKAARFYGAGDVRIEEVDMPVVNDGKVLVEIEWCGICGSDLHEYLTGPAIIRKRGDPHPLTHETLPTILGHEFCGRVREAPRASGLQPGQAVMVDPRLHCRSCRYCRTSFDNICASFGFRGLSGGGGGCSEFVAVDADMCYALPHSVDVANAALLEPLAVGKHAVKGAGQQDWPQTTCLVVGGGPIGQAVLFMLKAHGAGKVFVSEPTSTRYQQIAKLADATFSPLRDDVAGECRALTDSSGVDVVFDCAGIPSGLVDAMDSVRKGGTIVNVAGWETDCQIPMSMFSLKELTYKSSMGYTTEDFKETVQQFIEGRFDGVENMITGRILLDDLVTHGFEALINQKNFHTKILVTPKKEMLANYVLPSR